MEKQSFIYIMTNTNNTTLYIGVTNNIIRRVYEHRNKLVKGFTSKYNLTKLVYYEMFDDIINAITREKYLKGKKRDFKLSLINNFNPEWKDLYEDIARYASFWPTPSFWAEALSEAKRKRRILKQTMRCFASLNMTITVILSGATA